MKHHCACIVVIGLFTSGSASEARALVAGDIAIIGFNMVNPDDFAFVTLVNVSMGEEIKFTDNGWQSDDTFRTGEGIETFTFAADTPAGTVITFAGNGAFSGPSIALSATGDQILAYQGLDSAPTFIYAVNDKNPQGWQVDAIDTHTSALPLGLTNGTTAVALAELDNYIFDLANAPNGGAGGTKEEWLAAISNANNWTGQNSPNFTMPSGPLNVTTATIPEPNSLLIYVALGALFAGAHTRRCRRTRWS